MKMSTLIKPVKRSNYRKRLQHETYARHTACNMRMSQRHYKLNMEIYILL